MSMNITKIEIDFGERVELTTQDLQRLDSVIRGVCARYCEDNPERTMWPFGSGFKMTVNPFMVSDDEPLPFDMNVYHIECIERERLPHDTGPKYSRFSNPNEMFQDIRDFHLKFDLKYNGKPRHLPGDLDSFRTMFMAEELAEYVTGDKTIQNDIVLAVQRGVNIRLLDTPPGKEKQLDALVDLVYVALGTAYLHGFDFDEAWRRVHEANMAKVKVTKDTIGPRGEALHDVVKPPGWTAPDLSDLVDSE